ncbi:NADH dehydrogenase [ubiquinone] 1 beta subcomplex subunit 2, mitochondrial-like [Pectinophora gossypiella]|uniref:NADH dehydrogenase [ubiquinone] 1 beta subcomplex subunit 2, mitochondrial n=1 Tax=Pectinophora gossypiella TaxID=13191 RepID=A0A1E1WBI0_PECGO|nr:NADH dehydrogenase [ubiquinone] 1 beta subcomplex subunit 2, mitochondrial-like [Pectinophora gossypiella]
MLTRALTSRALLLRTLKNSADNVKQAKRNAGHGVWTYRMPPPMPSKSSIYLAEGLGAFAWWWVFYHIFTEPEHIYGEWPYVDPCTWTDQELGIPPDSKGPLKSTNM